MKRAVLIVALAVLAAPAFKAVKCPT